MSFQGNFGMEENEEVRAPKENPSKTPTKTEF